MEYFKKIIWDQLFTCDVYCSLRGQEFEMSEENGKYGWS